MMDLDQEIPPTTEIICLILSAIAIPAILMGFGIHKISEWVVSWGRDTWI